MNQASPLPSLGPVGFHPPACALRLLLALGNVCSLLTTCHLLAPSALGRPPPNIGLSYATTHIVSASGEMN